MQSRLVGIPIFINGIKTGVVDSGREKVFDLPAGAFEGRGEEGKQASGIIRSELRAGRQLKFELEIVPRCLGFFMFLTPHLNRYNVYPGVVRKLKMMIRIRLSNDLSIY